MNIEQDGYVTVKVDIGEILKALNFNTDGLTYLGSLFIVGQKPNWDGLEIRLKKVNP